MKKSRFTEEQVIYALRLFESGTPVSDVCRQMGISEATFYVWKKKYASLGVAELRQLRQLQDENARLKRLVADLRQIGTGGFDLGPSPILDEVPVARLQILEIVERDSRQG